MANLLWKKRHQFTLNLLSVPFKTEEEFEKTVFDTKEILEGVFFLRRQVRGGKKPGIPDIVGVDTDGKVCIIEIKNVHVTSEILPQVLQYAFWAESNPDSIKTMWFEADETPEGLEPNFEHNDVRIIVIAPSIDKATLELLDKINYDVELVEIKRWTEGANQFLLVNRLEPEEQKKVRPVKGLQTYDRAFYKKQHSSASVDQFMKYVAETNAQIKRLKLPLQHKFNKGYCGFKYGFFNAFGIKWMASKSFAFFFKLDEARAKRATPKGMEMSRYDRIFKEAVYRIEPGKTQVRSFEPLFRAAVEALNVPSDARIGKRIP